ENEGLDKFAIGMLDCIQERRRVNRADSIIADDGISENLSTTLDKGGLAEDEHSRRLLAFVCHNTGGLVVKQASVHAATDAKYGDIPASCIGVAFFGMFLLEPSFSEA